jgi:predicted nucleotide-binding protein
MDAPGLVMFYTFTLEAHLAKLSGKTQQALAQLLETEATHSLIETLYLRFEVPTLVSETNPNPNKLTKATHLVKQLDARGDGTLSELIEYAASPSSRMSTAFRRGSSESRDLYASLDRDSSAAAATKSQTAPSAPKRRFAQPGTTAPSVTSTHDHAAIIKRYVFVVRGRDKEAYDALAAFLTALDIRIVTWDDATRGVGSGSPHTLDIVRSGIDMSDAVVVLMTPDDLRQVKPEFGLPTDDSREGRASGQARQNVVFEAGWAMALNQHRVVLVRVGEVRNLSDIEGLNYVHLTNDISSRRTLIGRLRNCELAIDDSGESWRTAGTFPETV